MQFSLLESACNYLTSEADRNLKFIIVPKFSAQKSTRQKDEIEI